MRDMAAALAGCLVGAVIIAMMWLGYEDGRKLEERTRTDIMIEFQQMRIKRMAIGLEMAEKRILLCKGYTE